MGGTTTTNTTQQQQGETAPWAPAQPLLAGLLGGLNTGIGNAAPTGSETDALAALQANAAATPNLVPQATGLAGDLMAGGKDRSSILSNAYDAAKSSLTPFARGDYVDPNGNPAVRGYLDTILNDVTNNVNGQFAAAGRDLSGINTQTLARGIAQGEAPVLANQYNVDRNNQLGAINALLGAGKDTTAALAGLDQTALANRQAGLNLAGTSIPALQDAQANRTLAADAKARALPLGNLSAIEQLGIPIAQLGSQSSGSSAGTQSQTIPAGPSILGGILGGIGLASKLVPSDERLKEDIAPVGATFDGTPVVRFRYAGDPTMRMGMIAQDVEQTTPEAVHEIGGYKTVDYKLATDRAAEADPGDSPSAGVAGSANADNSISGGPNPGGPPLAVTPPARPGLSLPMSPGASLWGRLGSSLADNSSLLMALGGGLAGARTWGEGIGKALSQGSQVSAAQQKASDMQRAQTQTYEALLARGVPPQLAVAAAQNPTLLKYVLNRFAAGGQSAATGSRGGAE